MHGRSDVQFLGMTVLPLEVFSLYYVRNKLSLAMAQCLFLPIYEHSMKSIKVMPLASIIVKYYKRIKPELTKVFHFCRLCT